MSVRGGSPYEYEDSAHENSLERLDQAFRMLRLGRQGGVERKKLPPLGPWFDFGEPWPIGHLAAHPGRLTLGVVPGLLPGGRQRDGEGGLAAQVGGELADADRLHRRQRGVEVAGGER